MIDTPDFLAAAPPAVTACAALAYVLCWQGAGTAILAPLLRRSGVPACWSLILGWFLWLPLAGTVAEVIAVSGHASAALFRGLTLAVALAAAAALWCVRARARLGFSWPRLRWAWAPVAAVVVLQLMTLVFAAHPERLYDQLSYHLVVAKRALAFGGPFVRLYDPHLLIAGPVEYAFLWPRALWASDFFEMGAAQAWVYVAAVLPCLAAAAASAHAAAGKYRWWVALAAAAAVPGLLPNNELVHIAKPGALLFAGAFLTFVAAFTQPQLFAGLALGLSMLLVGCNPTFVHVAIGLGVAVVCDWRRLRATSRVPWAVVAVGAVCLAASLWRSLSVTGTFLYPTDARFLPTPYADDVTLAYWRYIAFGSGQAFAARWSGPFRVLARSPGLAVWVGLAVATLAAQAWRSRAARAPDGAWDGWRRLAWFFAAYAAVWPCFYDGFVYSRFVAGYVAALVAVAFFAALTAPGRSAAALAVVGLIAGVACSSADEMARKLWSWNGGTLAAEFAGQYPRYVAMQVMNTWVKPTDTVLSDGPEKFFLTAASLSGAISPQERQGWDALTVAPQAAAKALGVQAVVIEASRRGLPDDQRPFVGPVYDVFERLAPFGQIQAIGGDLVLGSACYFQALPCPTGD